MQNKWVINVLLIIIMILVVIACVVAYMREAMAYITTKRMGKINHNQ